MHNVVFESRRVTRAYVGVFDWLVSNAFCDNAPINVNPVGGGGGNAGKGWGFDKFLNFLIKFPRVGNERSIKSVKKAPTTGEKI